MRAALSVFLFIAGIPNPGFTWMNSHRRSAFPVRFRFPGFDICGSLYAQPVLKRHVILARRVTMNKNHLVDLSDRGLW